MKHNLNFLKIFLIKFFKTSYGVGLLISSIVLILSYNYAGSFDDIKNEYKIEKYFEINGKHVYVTESLKANKVLDEKHELVNDKIEIYEYHDINIVLWIVFTFSLVVFLALLLNSEFIIIINNSKFKTYMHFLKVEKEDGCYNYYYRNKLIKKSASLLSVYNFLQSDFKNLNMNLDYEPKSKKRKRIFNEIGV